MPPAGGRRLVVFPIPHASGRSHWPPGATDQIKRQPGKIVAAAALPLLPLERYRVQRVVSGYLRRTGIPKVPAIL